MDKVEKVLFIGSKKLGFQVLQEIHTMSPETLIGILTIDDSDDTRTALKHFVDFSNTKRITLHIAKNRKHSEEIIKELKPDLCLVVGWYWLVSQEVLRLVPKGFIGIHNSLLPKYRGGSPLIWSIINGDKEVGFSLFSFTEGMDDGAIWAQTSISLGQEDYVSEILEKLERKTIEVLHEKYFFILDGSLAPTEQNHELATYCAQRTPNDGNIDWYKPVSDIYNFIRAQSSPYPGAFTYLNNQKLIIWKAKPFRYKYYGVPGQIARIHSDGVYIICGDNKAIILEDVEIVGKKGKAYEFIKSIKYRLSSVIKENLRDTSV